ncbi:MAG: type IX secretion system sortase PorU [Paludibacteraceae bacterium]|nr:type IX secretion system sortase PorU [Paludibacteraceae bacterium]
MKRHINILLLLLLSLPMLAGIHSYTEQSVLSSGHWVKIRVSESGVCRMSFSQLQQAGLNPQQLRVYGYGGAMLEQDFTQKKIDDLPQVPVYIGGDYVLFWVQGPIDYTYNDARYAHTRNVYSDFGYYMLTDNVGEMLAPTEGETIAGTPTEVTTYQLFQVHEKDSLNLVDRTGESGCGREMYGEGFTRNGHKRSFTFETPNALVGEKSLVYIPLAAYSSANESFFSIEMNGTSNSTRIAPVSTTDFYTMARTNNASFRAENVAERQVVNITFKNNSVGQGWINYIEMTTPCSLVMNGDWMNVQTNVNFRTYVPVRFHLSKANSNMQIWDITDLSNIQKMQTTMRGDTLLWVGTQSDDVHKYVAVNLQGSNYVKAEIVGNVENQNLHGLKNIDYVIICPDSSDIIAAAQDLAKAHQDKEGITWAVVTDKQVFNEFSSGTPDATAFRWLMKMLYDRADGAAIAKPRWLLLMGHGSYDHRKILKNSGINMMLTYESKNSTNEVDAYMTDDYFGWLDDNEGTVDSQARMDIGVGRLPIYNAKEARKVVDKLIAYINNTNAGSWKNQIIFLADDGEHGKHTKTAESGAEKVRKKNPDFIVNKIYLDAYPQEVNASGESYPLAKNRLNNLLKNGALFFDYSGHGGYNAITNESMLNINEIEQMNNKNHSFWLFATCSFAHCDGGKRSAAEAAILNPIGGAIGVLSATRTVYADQNTMLNGNVCDTLFGHKNAFHYEMTLGEATAIGKNRTGTDPNKLAYILLGDPAMRLNYPTNYQVQTTTNIDTLNALSTHQVEGRIIDEDSVVVSDFNGKVQITVYDKMQVIHTRDNDSKEDEEINLEYNDFPNTIFSGAADVKDGLFKYSFMVPKDIRYNYGNGRIVYYAYTTDDGELAEAIGHYEDFVVGGTGNILKADTTGPEMRIYLNTPTFEDGGKTYETPRFFADLYDANGINTAGAGIGHELLLVVDNNPKMTYSLNEYFTSASGSYQEGQVNYLMEKMSNGPHTLTFRAWDMLNNSTTQTLNFVVDAGLDPSICSVTTYPNPVQATGLINLVVNYDQPDETLQTELYLYNLSGQMVWSHKQDNPDQVSINLSEIGLTPGVYVYTVKIKSATSKYSTSAGKIIVTK